MQPTDFATVWDPHRSDNRANEGDFEDAFGQTFEQVLDMDTWTTGDQQMATYARLEQEIIMAVADEDRYRQHLRQTLLSGDFFKRLQLKHQLPIAGKYTAQPAAVDKVQQGLLFTGAVEACDGISLVHDTLPLTITQLGVCLVAYNGGGSSYTQRLYRRDLRAPPVDPVADVLRLLSRRQERESQGLGGNTLSELARRSLMTYAERMILAHHATAPWRLGHGSPAPYELLTNFWTAPQHIHISLDLIRWYVLTHQKFVFVPSAPRDRHLLTLGYALEPLEYAIIGSLKADIDQLIQYGSYRHRRGVLAAMEQFRDEVASQVVVGLYRVSPHAPPYLFYAHIDHADMAAHIVMADSLLQEHRGFPLLIDLADALCKSAFGGDSFFASIQTAYARAGQPYRYLGERETRYR